MSDQVWTVAVTPGQRLILLNLSHGDGQKLKGQRGRVFRRFVRAFGVDAISTAAALHPEGRVNAKMAVSRAPALHTLTAENVDYALDLLEVERTPASEMVIGPLFDVLEDLKAGREVEAAADIPAYDPAAEDWTTPKAPTPEHDIPEKIAAYLRSVGQVLAAELVDRGAWDKREPPPPPAPPAPPPNGEAHPTS